MKHDKLLLFLLIGMAVHPRRSPDQREYYLSGGYTVTITGHSASTTGRRTIREVTGGLVAGRNARRCIDRTSHPDRHEVRSIKSDMGTAMDNKTYKALKADANPQITFLLGCTFHRIAN